MKILLTFILACILISSCKKEGMIIDSHLDPVPVKHYDNYLPFKVGNYWIYERFQVEQHGAFKSLNQFDSVYIEKDTLIRNIRFFKFRSYDFIFKRQHLAYFRDSLHYIVDSQGSIQFSSEDFSTVYRKWYHIDSFGDTLYVLTSKMNDKDLEVSTIAGTFSTSTMQNTVWVYPKYQTQGVNNPRYMNTRYCKNIGVIIDTEPYYLNSSFRTERRLIRYHLN